MASSRPEKINGLQDLVEKMSTSFPLPVECIENAKTQYKILQGVSFSTAPLDLHTNYYQLHD